MSMPVVGIDRRKSLLGEFQYVASRIFTPVLVKVNVLEYLVRNIQKTN
jgi:hypothetical protein